MHIKEALKLGPERDVLCPEALHAILNMTY